jgi:pimeloyl-ACP methyl ester carboxylesterase
MSTVSNGDVTINVQEAGAGTPVMLVHGIGLRADVWINQFDTFAEHYHVIAPDLRGSGASSHPDTAGAYAIDRFVDDLILVVREIAGGPVHFVGTSSGGFVGQAMALRAPDLLRSLVLCHSSSVNRIPAGLMSARIRKLKNATMEDYAQLVASQALAHHQRPAVHEWFLEILADNDRDIYEQILVELMQSFDLRKRAHAIRTPTLVVLGDHDRVVPPSASRETAQLIPKARKAVLRGVGHCGYIEQPLEFNRIVMRFIDHVERKRALKLVAPEVTAPDASPSR